ncbi:response regulator [Cohnella silvisoli]|uniref:Response regulator n=1 Tax=Cohnella silvisoli TaxID=2873699 RepID=A0ABV1KQ66_9BACL|nr:response regulator [Cohnella silvisoli]
MLIVDDDKLVRKGLMVLMPWEQFGLKVIGEAANGEAALQLLKDNPVDLLITDLAMPVMSGIELMRTVRIHYPQIWLVVLTFHQDFEYIQESLRLGAIDYIVKTQLDKESMEDILQRIMGRITEMSGNRSHMNGRVVEEKEEIQFQSDCGLALIALQPEIESQWAGRLAVKPGDYLTEADQGGWLWVRDFGDTVWLLGDDLHERLKIDSRIVIVRLCDIKGIDKADVIRWLREFRNRGLLYELEPGKRIYEVSIVAEQQSWPLVFDNDVHDMYNRWSSLSWVNNNLVFHEWLTELKRLRLSKAKLESLFYSAGREWERTLSAELLSGSKPVGSLSYWYEWIEWLQQMRSRINEITNRSMYSRPIVDSILKAANLITQDITQQISLIEMARTVNMSRSYFSQCFKDIIGKPYNEYVRDQRIAAAEHLLTQTNMPINRIAVKTGYPNEKYFSRLFREQTGLTPTEYRLERQNGAQLSIT